MFYYPSQHFCFVFQSAPITVSAGDVAPGQIIAANGQTYSVMPQAAVHMQALTIDGQEVLYIPSGLPAAQTQQQMVSYGTFKLGSSIMYLV